MRARKIPADEMTRRLQDSLKKSRPKRQREQHQREALRAWAAQPLAAFRLTMGEGRVCTLEQDGRIVGTWNRDEAPWLHSWLCQWLPVLHGAWHVAQAQLAAVNGAKDGGKKTGKKTTKASRERDAEIARRASGFPDVHKKAPLAGYINELDSTLGTTETIRKKLLRR